MGCPHPRSPLDRRSLVRQGRRLIEAESNNLGNAVTGQIGFPRRRCHVLTVWLNYACHSCRCRKRALLSVSTIVGSGHETRTLARPFALLLLDAVTIVFDLGTRAFAM